jgi:hypothetical protein
MYKIVQNKDAFAFTDRLIGEGCTYETAGSLQDGKKVNGALHSSAIDLFKSYYIFFLKFY